MPIPIPINEVTGTIAVVTVLAAYVFRKQFWKAITNWGADGQRDDQHDEQSN